MKVSAGFADGCIGGVFSSVMFLSFAYVSISFGLKGDPLSDSCFSRLPYASYICSRADMTLKLWRMKQLYQLGSVKPNPALPPHYSRTALAQKDHLQPSPNIQMVHCVAVLA